MLLSMVVAAAAGVLIESLKWKQHQCPEANVVSHESLSHSDFPSSCESGERRGGEREKSNLRSL